MLSSKQFLINRVLEQAELDGVPLTEIEIRMLGFSEATAASRDLEAAQEFDRDYDDEEYEAKIAELIRHAYERDKASGSVELWDAALIQVSGWDRYLNVMIDRSGIASQPFGPFADWRFIVYGLLPCGLALVAAAMIGLSPLGARLIRNDALRLLIAILLIASPFAIQPISRSKLWNSRRKRRHHTPIDPGL